MTFDDTTRQRYLDIAHDLVKEYKTLGPNGRVRKAWRQDKAKMYGPDAWFYIGGYFDNILTQMAKKHRKESSSFLWNQRSE